MKTLHEHCQIFHGAIFAEPDSAARSLESDFVPAGKLNLTEAFEVYREGYSARAVEALGEIYEVLWRFLGDDDFFELIEAYIEIQPSNFQNLSHWGQGLPEFLQSQEADPILCELSRFCWLQHQMFHSASESIAIAEIPGLQFERRFEIFNSPYRILELWNAVLNNTDFAEDIEQPTQTLVFLKEQRVHLAELNVDHDFLMALRDFPTEDTLSLEKFFTEVSAVEPAHPDDTSQQIQTLFTHLRQVGLFFEVQKI